MGTRRATIFRLAKGFRGRRKNCFKLTVNAVHRALKYAYVSRRLRKREARRTWIVQINAGAKEHGLSYGKLIYGMVQADIGVNRKMLAQLAQQEPCSFRAIVEEAKLALSNLAELPGAPGRSETPEGSSAADGAASSSPLAAAATAEARAGPTTLMGLAQDMAERGELDGVHAPATEEEAQAELRAALGALAIGGDEAAAARH